MQARTQHLAVTLAGGTAAAGVLWTAGAPELAWLGYVAAVFATAAAGRRCLPRRRA